MTELSHPWPGADAGSSRETNMIVVIMGICGCGKSSIGKLLAKKIGCSFLDADDYHTVANKAKMAKRIPLTDENKAVCHRLVYSSKSGSLAMAGRTA